MFRATVSIEKVRMRVRAATAHMHAHSDVILAIASQRKGPQETKTRVVVLPGLFFAGGKQSKTRAQYSRNIYPGQCFGAGGDPQKSAGASAKAYICC